ncbi:hypothetical protein A4U53_001975 (plasmid) [Rhizobium ruizarguesonis]|uniref:Short-chain dehydrogenase n=2 Tax=Rhizobium TaxID=379 RepID=A0A179C0V7_RHILE|nr:hypothetical protein [Rhizobium leguminosarum]OAP97060.1 hypothetical protein A4U53_37145 [Rhizobium leguminosarum]
MKKIEFDASLLIGATGMLTAAAEWVAERSVSVILVARNASSSPLCSRNNVKSLDLDWRDPLPFVSAIVEASMFESVQLAVIWVHGSGVEAAQGLLPALSQRPCLIVQVRGSQALHDIGTRQDPPFEMRGRARLITVTLGAKWKAGRKRWLTWDEISAGVVTAINARESQVIGSLSP